MSHEQAATAAEITWGASILTRVLTSLLMVGCLIGAIAALLDKSAGTSGDGPNDHYYAAIAIALLAPIIWRMSFYPKVHVTSRGVTVRNPFRTRTIEWSQLRSVRPGYSGLVFRRKDGGSVTAWAVQQANLSTWLKRQARAKRIAAQIAQLGGIEAVV